MRRRQQKGPKPHYLILSHKKAEAHAPRLLRRLTMSIRRQNGYYTVVERDRIDDLVAEARALCRPGRRARRLPSHIARRGEVSSLVVAGGDVTVNRVASVALEADLPMGILPMGHYNSIARSLSPNGEVRDTIGAIVGRKYRTIDTARFGDRVVVGSVGIGFTAHLAELLEGKKPPRFGFRWATLGTKAAAAVRPKKTVIKADTFRFEIVPTILNINLLPYTLNLLLSQPSIADDGLGEIILDVDLPGRDLGAYTRDVLKGKYLYGNKVRLFRGAVINIRPLKGRMVLIDGDIIKCPYDEVEMHVGEKQLKVFCR